jgi:hypothetical protein
MVNPKTWRDLGEKGQSEFQSLFNQFQSVLRANGIHDGYDFGTNWAVVEIDGMFVISNGEFALPHVESTRKDVIDALYNDACANLNR